MKTVYLETELPTDIDREQPVDTHTAAGELELRAQRVGEGSRDLGCRPGRDPWARQGHCGRLYHAFVLDQGETGQHIGPSVNQSCAAFERAEVVLTERVVESLGNVFVTPRVNLDTASLRVTDVTVPTTTPRNMTGE